MLDRKGGVQGAPRAINLLAALVVLGGLAGCAQVPPPPPATAGSASKPAPSDRQVRDDILRRWREVDLGGGIDVSVTRRKAVLTGRLPSPDRRAEAVKLAWQADGVDEVVNEIQVDNKSGLSDEAGDAVITARLRSALLFDEDIESARYTIDTVNGTVYLTGKARSQRELDKVLAYAREVPRVRRVVNHVQL